MLKSSIEAKLQSAEERLSLLHSEIKSAKDSMNYKKLKYLKAERVSLETSISNFKVQLSHLENISKNVFIAKEQGLPSKVHLPENIQEIISNSAFT